MAQEGTNRRFSPLNDTKIRTSALATILLRELLLSLLRRDLPWSIQDLDDELMLSLNRGNNRQAAGAPEIAPADSEHTSAPQPARRATEHRALSDLAVGSGDIGQSPRSDQLRSCASRLAHSPGPTRV